MQQVSRCLEEIKLGMNGEISTSWKFLGQIDGSVKLTQSINLGALKVCFIAFMFNPLGQTL